IGGQRELLLAPAAPARRDQDDLEALASGLLQRLRLQRPGRGLSCIQALPGQVLPPAFSCALADPQLSDEERAAMRSCVYDDKGQGQGCADLGPADRAAVQIEFDVKACRAKSAGVDQAPALFIGRASQQHASALAAED